ncbi:MAG TPA: branched-chain amino acid ABC transporter permease [Alphaproteobacteria bacterium]|nr:branched-chain amino acid ABC transporter permease [Alphaproteobacteria bacterium]
MTATDYLDLLIKALLLAGIYAAMAVGMTVIYGVMKIVNLAHAGFLMLGAYFAFELFERFHIDPVLSAVLALPVFFLFGMAVHVVLIRWLPKSDTPTLASLLLMFGFWQVLQNFGYLKWGTTAASILTERSLHPAKFGEIYVSQDKLIVFAAAVASLIVLQLIFNRSWFGRSMRSLIQNPYAAKIVGVDDEKTARMSFGLGTAFAGFAGALLALLYPFTPDFGPPFLLRSFVIIVLGGLESVSGVAIGALILAVLETFSINIPIPWYWHGWQSHYLPASYQPIVPFLLLVVVLLVLPKGIGGLLEKKWRVS